MSSSASQPPFAFCRRRPVNRHFDALALPSCVQVHMLLRMRAGCSRQCSRMGHWHLHPSRKTPPLLLRLLQLPSPPALLSCPPLQPSLPARQHHRPFQSRSQAPPLLLLSLRCRPSQRQLPALLPLLPCRRARSKGRSCPVGPCPQFPYLRANPSHVGSFAKHWSAQMRRAAVHAWSRAVDLPVFI